LLHEEIVNAFRERFVTPEGFLASSTQTAYVLALHFDLLPEKLRPVAARELVRDIEKRNHHIATGFVGTPYILEVLETHGYLDVAYRLLEQETFPSWLFPVKNGATTIWERWDGWTPDKGFQDKGMNSFNHYAYGAVGAWMYRSVAGLELDPQEPGYRHIVFRPRPGGLITWAKAGLETPQGRTEISWKLDGKNLEVEVLVPEGAHATFSPPAGYRGDKVAWGSGRHRLVLESSAN
jgi:alpha-L-rhamnosidase